MKVYINFDSIYDACHYLKLMKLCFLKHTMTRFVLDNTVTYYIKMQF